MPLSVYLKGKNAYAGYRGIWHPELLLVLFLSGAQTFLLALVLLYRRTDWRLLVCVACCPPRPSSAIYRP